MLKNALMFLGMLVAMPATAMAEIDWLGTTADFSLVSNYSGDPDGGGYDTYEASYDPGDMTGSYEPLISGTSTQWGYARMRNSITVSQDSGDHRWMNGTGSNCAGLSIYSGALLDMSGGTHITDQLVLGARYAYGWKYTYAAGSINVWGGAFKIKDNPFVPDLNGLYIDDDGSVIDLRGTGTFEVPLALQSTVDGYIGDGRIVAGEEGTSLVTRVDIPDDKYVISLAIPGDFDLDGDVDVSDLGILATNYDTASGMTWGDGDATGDAAVDVSDLGILATYYGTGTTAASVPEPGTLLMLCLGLGSLALIRRR